MGNKVEPTKSFFSGIHKTSQGVFIHGDALRVTKGMRK